MNKTSQWTGKTIVVLSILILLALACNVPGAEEKIVSEAEEALGAVEQTASALSTQVAATQAAMGIDAAEDAVEQAEEMAGEAAELAESVLPGGDASSESQLPEDLPPGSLPKDPGEPKEVIEDTNASLTAENQYVTEGDVYETNLLERPFTSDMTYIPELDILRAEISFDGNFFIVSIFMNGSAASTPGIFAVELDTDKDGRGDFLVWVTPPLSTEWSANNISVRMDPNADVGGQHPVKDDGTTGNGYETEVLTTAQAIELGTAWARIAPSDPKNIQIAFRGDFLDNREKFLWSVWADNSFKDPAKFDYNDQLTLADAGSPIEGKVEYPLKQLHSVDNTCRMVYGFPATGLEPGGCGTDQEIPKDPGAATMMVPTLPAITPPPGIEVPTLP